MYKEPTQTEQVQTGINVMFVELLYKKNILHLFKDKNELFYKKSLELKEFSPVISNWNCDTFNTMYTYELTRDPLFKDLIEECKQQVAMFATKFGVVNKRIECINAWLNVALPGNFQEYHIHNNSHFSLVYYVKAPKNGGELILKSHEADSDMFALPATEYAKASNKVFRFYPQEGDLVVFRSNISHMVNKNMSNENRVSIAMNLNVI